MRKGPPLKRYKGLARKPFKRTPSRPRGRGKSKVPVKVREAVARRAMGQCEIRANGRCEGRGYHCHHVILRSRGGPHTAENLLYTCYPCHAYVHAHIPYATERGWIARRPLE